MGAERFARDGSEQLRIDRAAAKLQAQGGDGALLDAAGGDSRCSSSLYSSKFIFNLYSLEIFRLFRNFSINLEVNLSIWSFFSAFQVLRPHLRP